MRIPSPFSSPALFIIAGLTLAVAWSLSFADARPEAAAAVAQEAGQASAHDEEEAVQGEHDSDGHGNTPGNAHGNTPGDTHGDTPGDTHSNDVHGHREHVDPVGRLPLWTTIPFIGILLSIALGPLVAPHWWHRNFPKASVFWALASAVHPRDRQLPHRGDGQQ